MSHFRSHWYTKVFACVLPFLLIAPNAYAQQVGTVTYLEGRVEVLKADENEAKRLQEEESVSIGDIIRTKNNSKAEITFKDNSKLQLAQGTKVEIKDYQLTKKNVRKVASIHLERGKVRALVAKRKKGDFNIITPNANGTIKGSEIFAFYAAGSTGMLVSSGSLVVNPVTPAQTAPIPITPGNSILIDPAGQLKGPRPFLELEKEFHLKDTSPPLSVTRKENLEIIKGVVTSVSGDVKITPEGQTESHQASEEEVVKTGDKVETGEDGYIEMSFDNGNSLNLKPNTHLIIVKLVVDGKTKEFENLFEVKMGSVKAVVENLKGDSSFKIKTPQATSGVRGTIMYLVVSSLLTQAIFEGGPGYITSLFSGITQDVGVGEGSSADNVGNITDPVAVSGVERASFSESFQSGGGDAEGYSSPEGYLFEGDSGIDAGTEGGGAGDTETSDDSSVDIPVTESNTSLLLQQAEAILAALPDFFVNNKTITPRVRISDFDDGSVQGWTKVPVFDGDLSVENSGGNPNGFLFSTDTAGGGVLYTKMPDAQAALFGSSSGIFWDEFVYDNGNNTSKKVGIILKGSDGTLYMSEADWDNNIEVWTNRFVSFEDADDWDRLSGSASFTEVVANLDELYISTETATKFNGNRESGIDNVTFLLDTNANLTVQALAGDITRNAANTSGNYSLVTNGSYGSLLPAGWQITGLTGNTTSSGNFVGGSWIAGMNGTAWANNNIGGTYKGVWIELKNDGTLSGKVMTGDVAGSYIDVNEGATWTAASSGGWVEVDSLIDLSGFNDDVTALSTPIVPITEVYSSLLTGSGNFTAGGTLTVSNLLLDFFANDVLALNGIWAANVSGSFTTPTGNDWNASVSGNLVDSVSNSVIGTVDATLTGTQWNSGNWQANVDGSTNTGIALAGQAAGTYDNSAGTFSGGGTGTWE